MGLFDTVKQGTGATHAGTLGDATPTEEAPPIDVTVDPATLGITLPAPIEIAESDAPYNQLRWEISASSYNNADGNQITATMHTHPYRVLSDGTVEEAPERLHEHYSTDTAVPIPQADADFLTAVQAAVAARIGA
jgi:hypothetical protein